MRIAGIILTALFGIPFLLCSWLALTSRFGSSDGDPHGYAMIFGTLFAIGLSIPAAFSVPLIVAKEQRTTAILVCLAALVVVDAGLFIALATA